MHMVTFTKKKVKRLTVIGSAAAGTGAIVTSVVAQVMKWKTTPPDDLGLGGAVLALQKNQP